jgi:hypothetical protein
MANPNVKFVDATTGAEEIRPMTDEEFAEYKADLAFSKKQADSEAASKASAVEKLLALGLTEAEIQALAG